MAEEQNDESTVPADTDQRPEAKPSPAKPTLGIYLLVFSVGGLGFWAGYLLRSTLDPAAEADSLVRLSDVLPLAGMWLAWSCLLAIRCSSRHGIVPGVVFGLAVVGFPVLISAGCWLAASIWHPGPNSYLLFVSTGIGGLAGSGLGAWLIYKTAKWLDTKKPPATDSDSTEADDA